METNEILLKLEEFPMANIHNHLSDLIGNTPMVRLQRYCEKHQLKAEIIAKLEYFNPLGSAKDRVAKYMIDDAQKKGLIQKDTLIIEPTSGNTGVGLAFICAEKGLRLILTMPETMSIERRNLLKALGAELVLTEGAKGMKGAIEKANQLAKENPNSFIPSQFDNPINPEVHRQTTAKEILQDTDGKIDAFVAGVGTGGTITGVGEILKQELPNIKIVATEPADSPVLSGGKGGPHKLQGIGAGFVPSVMNTDIIDEIITITTEQAYQTTRELAQSQGILVGISSGAALAAATQLAQKPELEGKTIVVFFPDTGERYLSTPGLFD